MTYSKHTNWRDGGGGYAPGSDTPDAPWNQPDCEVTDENIEDSTKEVWFLLEWRSDISHDDIQFYDLFEMMENVFSVEYWNEIEPIISEMETINETRGVAAAVSVMPEHRREEIKLHAEVWVQERAEERAAFPGLFE